MTKRQSKPTPLLKVFLSYRPTLRHMLRRIVPLADVDDIVQEAFIRAHEAEVDKRIEHPKAFIYTTARNLALNFIAKKENNVTSKLEDLHDSDVYLIDHRHLDEHESKEKFRLFCSAARDLPPQSRKAFIMKRVFGYSIKEIALCLDISESTAEKHIAKGVLRSADYLRDNGYVVTKWSKHPIRKKTTIVDFHDAGVGLDNHNERHTRIR